jgi:hypothetical protein
MPLEFSGSDDSIWNLIPDYCDMFIVQATQNTKKPQERVTASCVRVIL